MIGTTYGAGLKGLFTDGFGGRKLPEMAPIGWPGQPEQLLEPIMAGPHPLVRATGRAPEAGGTTLTQVTVQDGDNAALLHRSALFYSQVLGVPLFLSERHGPLYIREPADRLTTADDPRTCCSLLWS